MAGTIITGGLVIDDVASATAGDDAPQTKEEQLAHRVISASRQGSRHAAYTAAKELLREIAAKGGISFTLID